MAKEAEKTIKLEIPAAKATPAPPLGPILGQNGINIGEFTREFNEKTKDMIGDVLPVLVEVFKDRTFKMKILNPTVASMIKKKFGIEKGSATPNKVKLKKIKKEELRDIAERKLSDLNTKNIDSAINIVAGTARSLGLEIID